MREKNWRRGLPASLLCLGLLLLAGGLESASEGTGRMRGYLVTSASAGRNAALAQAGGEFRIVAANLLWNRVIDHYHHQYLATGGDWSKNESLLPLLQTIIALDPHFVQAYEIMGGAILPRTGRIPEGERVLRQGLRANPNEWELYREMAMLLARTENRPAEALPYAEQGLAQASDDFSRHLMTRLVRTLRREIKDGSGAISSRPAPGRAKSPSSPPPSE